MLAVFISINVLFLSGCAVEAAKSDPKFRMEKINFVWSKASIHVKDEKVASKLQVRISFDLN